jgi:hypothetical protein
VRDYDNNHVSGLFVVVYFITTVNAEYMGDFFFAKREYMGDYSLKPLQFPGYRPVRASLRVGDSIK